MTKDQNDYLKTWLFRANEDIAVIDGKAGDHDHLTPDIIDYILTELIP